MKLGIVGATGLVGLELRRLLNQEPWKALPDSLELFASAARPEEDIQELAASTGALKKCDFLINAATAETAQWLRDRLGPSQVLIDNSSAFRLDPEVPLVVPEVNGGLLEAPNAVIANPNCTTILLSLPLKALEPWELMRVTVSTYQAASGAGLKGLEELNAQLAQVGRGETVSPPTVFPFQLALNVMSHDSSLRGEGRLGAGYNEEECKVMEETRKILGVFHLPISATCLRVPVRRAHTESVTVDLKKEMSLAELREAFQKMPGLKIVDDLEANHFPMPLEAESQNDVLIGRLRKDPVLPRTVHFLLVGDQLLKGAALNALQILQRLLDNTAA